MLKSESKSSLLSKVAETVDFERSLLSIVAQQRGIERAISFGVDDSMFSGDEPRSVWNEMVSHFNEFRAAPSLAAIEARLPHVAPNFRFEVVQDTFDFVLQGFFSQAKRRAAIELSRDLARGIDDPTRVKTIDEDFMTAARTLAAMFPQSRVTRFSHADKRIQEYEARKHEGERKGILYGIPEIDAVTNGIQPHEYVTVSGWSGTGKSTLTMFILYNAWLQGKTPLLFSLEMESGALMRKFDTLETNFSYSNLKRMNLTDEELDTWGEASTRIKECLNDIIVVDDVGRCTVERVYGEIGRYKPDIVAIDYITLMESTKKTNAMWETVTHITRDLKLAARDLSVPIIGVAQTNATSDGEFKGSNIAYSKSIVRDSDVMFDLYCDDEMREANKMQLRLVKNRDGRTLNTDLLWDVEHMRFEPWRDAMRFMDTGSPTMEMLRGSKLMKAAAIEAAV